MSRVLVNGITIAYEDVGTGDDVLVLVHGHPFNRTMWRPQVEWVANLNRAPAPAKPTAARLLRVIVPDLRGYGESTVVSGKTTLDVFASDIAGLLDGLGVQKVVIGGLSMGGQIVMEFCRRYPERVRGILLAATTCNAETQEGKQRRAAMADRLLREGMGPYTEEVLPKMVTPANLAALPGVAEHVRMMMRSTNPIGAAAAIRGRAERPDYAGTLAKIDVPALVVVGDEDAFTTRADAEQMSGLLRQSELVWTKGAGHMPNLEREVRFNDALANFLETHRFEPGFWPDR